MESDAVPSAGQRCVNPVPHSGARGRQVVMTPADEAALSALLRAAWPEMVIWGEEHSRDPGRPPTGRTYATIPECPGYTAEACFPREPWRPTYFWEQADKRRRGTWKLAVWPDSAVLSVTRGRGPSAEPTCGYPTPPRHIGASIVNISYATYNAAQRAACAKILRLLAKVATRDVRIVRWPSFETVATRSHLAWVGYDALRWCREDRARVVDFSITSGKMYGLAPLD